MRAREVITVFLPEAGLSRRDRFAAAAMQGLLADPEDIGPDEWPAGSQDCPDATARLAVRHADRLVRHLGRSHPRRQTAEVEDATDTLTLDVPAFIRALERAREDFKSDEDIHSFVERLLARHGQVISTADLP